MFHVKHFRYKAYSKEGWRTGIMTADSREDVIEMLENEGAHPVTIKTEHPLLRKTFWPAARLSSFFGKWAILLKSGIPIIRVFEIMEKEGEKKNRAIIKEMKEHLASGESISGTINMARVFPSFAAALIEVGEKTGTLEEQLSRLSSHYHKEEEMRRGIREGLAYPLFVMMFAVLMFVITMLYILPGFVEIFEEMNTELPAAARWIWNVSVYIRENTGELAGILLLVISTIIIFFRMEKGQKLKDRCLYRILFMRKIYACRLMGALTGFLEGGETLEKSLLGSCHVMGNSMAEEKVKYMAGEVEEGTSFKDVAARSTLFTHSIRSLIAIGMESGELPALLKKGTLLLEEEIQSKEKRIKEWLGPLVILIAGGMTALLLMTIVLPVLELFSKA